MSTFQTVPVARATLDDGTAVVVVDDSIRLTRPDDTTVVPLGGRAHRACVARRAGMVVVIVEHKTLSKGDGRIPEHYVVSYETRVFDVGTGAIARSDIPSRHETELLISPDGATLVTFRPEYAVWELPDGNRLASFAYSDLPLAVAAFDRDGRRFAVLCDGNPNPFAELNDRTPWETELRVWSRDGTLAFAERGAYRAVDYLGFSDDGRAVVGLDESRVPVLAWDVETGERCPVPGAPTEVEPGRSLRARLLSAR